MIVKLFRFAISSLKRKSVIVLHLSTMPFNNTVSEEIRTDIRVLLLSLLCLSLNFLPILLLEGVFTPYYVRGELIAVLAPVTTDVALQWISVSVATHVDGVHDMVQEEHSTVLTLEGP